MKNKYLVKILDFLHLILIGKEKKAPEKFVDKIKYYLKETVVLIVMFLFLNSFLIASFMVPTGSMENEVMTGDFLIVNKFIYGGQSPRHIPFTNFRLPWFRIPALKEVKRGDVICFEFPGYREEVNPEAFTYYLKRCVAIAGDTLEIKNRVVFINGKQLPIPKNMKFNSFNVLPKNYPDERIFPPTSNFNEDNYGPIVIPKIGMEINLNPENFIMWETFIKREGHKIELNENNQILIDGVLSSKYKVKNDYLFGMGDNRDNSLDSRYWGFIPKENLVGTPILVYWSWDSDIPLTNIFEKLSSVRFSRVGTLIN